jgi:hypothetical protein
MKNLPALCNTIKPCPLHYENTAPALQGLKENWMTFVLSNAKRTEKELFTTTTTRELVEQL